MRARTATKLLVTVLAFALLLPAPAAADPPASPAGPDGGGIATSATAAVTATLDGAPAWAHEASIYHVFVDRFRDGDPSNNHDVDPTQPFDDALRDWMGGDLAGVMQGLDHIESLGFDTIWLGPVYDGAYFHGYHPMDLVEVDPNFGTNAELAALVDAVHARGMRIVYDFVPNHTSDQHPWFQDVLEHCEDSDFYDYYRFNDCDADTGTYDYVSFFGIDELPELDLLSAESPAATYLLDEVVPFYLDPDDGLGFDGFRIDHAKGPGAAEIDGPDNQEFLAALRDAAAATNPDAYLFGEVWSPRDQIATYQDVLHGALNFPLHDALVAGLAGSAPLSTIDNAVRADLEAYGDGFVTTSFLDNHDVRRFVHRAGNDAAARERLKLAFTTQFTLPASPVVYYGTDVGMGQTANTEHPDGGWVDRWYREPMPWSDANWAHSGGAGFVLQEWNQDVADLVSALNDLRDDQPALVHGGYETVAATSDLLAYERVHGDDRLLVVINRGGATTLHLADLYGAAIPDGVTLTGLLDGEVAPSSDGDLSVDVAATTGAVFAVDGELPPAPGPDGTPPPDVPSLVVLPGNFQSELGCAGDWDPGCPDTALDYDATGDVWRGTFTIPAGTWEYKVALDGSWDVNYGQGAVRDGPNIVLELDAATDVTFVFSHRTGWVGNDHDHVLATVPGDFNAEIGCPGDWQPDCFRTWLQDIDGDGTYTYTTSPLTGGSYQFKVAVDGGWDVNYGAGGAFDGPNITADVGAGERLRIHFTPPADQPTGAAGLSFEVIEGEDPPPPPPSESPEFAVVHYQRADGAEHEWGLHLWGDVDPAELRDWPDHKLFTGETDYGRFTWIRLAEDAAEVGMVVARGDDKDPDADLVFDPRVSPEVWIREGDPTVHTSRAAAQGYVEIHYPLDGGDGSDLGLHLWGDALADGAGTDWESPRPIDGTVDGYARWQVPVDDVDAELGFIVRRGQDKEIEDDLFLTPSATPSAWLRTGDPRIHGSKAAAENLAVLHYHRPDGDYGAWDDPNASWTDFWGLHTWGGATDPGWTNPRRPVREDGFGVVFEVPLSDDATSLNYILHRGDTKDVDPDQTLDLQRFGHEVWILSGREEFLLPIVRGAPSESTDLQQQRAHFVSSELIAWPFATPDGATYRLHHAPEGGLQATATGVVGGGDDATSVELALREGGLPASITDTDGFRHLGDRAALEVPSDVDLDAWLTGQLAVSATSADGTLLAATGLQVPGVLDERFADDDAPLGPTWDGDVPSLGLWAPTAKHVRLHLFDAGTAAADGGEAREVVDLTRDGGFWSVTGESSWDRDYYLFEVEVYVPGEDAVVTNLVTDPYALSLAADSERSQLVRLGDAELAPDGWSSLDKPAFAGQHDMVVYELHVRDFSASDETVPEELRGTYRAFTLDSTDGRTHLQALADAGLTHVHLLPVFDIATIPERREDQVVPDIPTGLPPDSPIPQEIQQATRDQDAFNWGYDPFHFTTPEGSYATDPMGETRIREFREMVAALNGDGLRVVKDVVYNHTNAAGQHERSVLDRIVPGYYHRLSDAGVVETSTCCPNTATEHAMMERLMIDSVLTWATEYKVDGFRFDLMGHHPKAQMLRLRAELDALTLEDDGVDGSAIVLYGEGWNFGEVENDARFVQATQANMAGTGVGTFNDRLRDGARGGNPFGGHREQGFVTGLYVDPNDSDQGSASQQEARARHLADLVRIGMAGNLADYAFEAGDGTVRRGDELDYGGSPAGYAGTPQDNVVYVSAHDNETWFDAIQYKVPLSTSLEDRVRVQNLGLATVMFSQGTPFFHAGSDLLRSKSLDRDSYNSGDWFNRLDWSRQTNNWGVGLPPEGHNGDNWPLMAPLLRDLPAPEPQHIDANAATFQELLAIRRSTPLFRLTSADAVHDQVTFHATGAEAPVGVIAMSITGGAPADGPDWSLGDGELPITDVLVVLNATPDEVTIDDPDVPTGDWELHPVLADSADEVVRKAAAAGGVFTVPARTAAVFVQLDEVDGEDPGGPKPPVKPGPPPWAPGPPPWAPGPPPWVPVPPGTPGKPI